MTISSIFFIFVFSFLILRFFRKTSALHILKHWWLSFENLFHLHQSFKIPLYDHNFRENQLYRKILTYLDSLPSVQDSDFTNLFSGPNPSDIFIHLDANQIVHDTFLGAKLSWKNNTVAGDSASALVLRMKKKDKRRVFQQYFQHILSVADEIEQRRKKDIKLFMNSGSGETYRWRSVPFTHPASFETVAMDVELKNKILASSYLGLKEHKLFPQVEEVFQTGARLSPAEVGEIMISNRNSPSRALKTVITAMQVQSNGQGQRLSHSGSGRGSEEVNDSNAVICRESVHTVREFRKLYGLLRLGSRRKEKDESLHSGSIEAPRIEGRIG
ncbi:hypothetical protein P8452_28004 [Trifolium repens]|nr:hypothetical protein P8452_28004 [Trifolium repens]